MEFALIDRIRRRAASRDDVVLGIGDDAAILRMPPGCELVVTTDSLNVGVHFPRETRADDVGWKALAVNLSDLAAMGADPAWCTLSLTLPDADAAWVDAFLDGFLALAGSHAVALVGGDTTRGPLAVSVTAHGTLPCGSALRRDAARADDDIWVTGWLGDAAAALSQWRSGGECDAALRARLDRPTPRIGIGRDLRGVAHACIDVSDGLLADLGHVLRASGVGATLQADQLPVSPALGRQVDASRRLTQQLIGGDDYELCFSAPVAQRARIEAMGARHATPITRIGVVEASSGLRVLDAHGGPVISRASGWDHFADASA
jgi:thiamine-monophosphate kinase